MDTVDGPGDARAATEPLEPEYWKRRSLAEMNRTEWEVSVRRLRQVLP